MSETRVTVGGRRIALTHRDKVLFPDGITKGDLIAYYRRIAPCALPHFRNRALTMERYPEGIAKPGFFQKNIPAGFPDWIERVVLEKEGGTLTQIIAKDAATLVYLANLGCITPHLALSTADHPRLPDRLVIDLDPSDTDFAKVQEAAHVLRHLLTDADINAFVQTTGSRGLHIVIPLQPAESFDRVRAWARSLAERAVARIPALLTLEMRKAQRGDRVFVDLMRNAYGQTAVAPYAVRAREGAPIATPLRWDEALASGLTPSRYTIRNIFRRLAKMDDPWAGFFDNPARLP